MKFKAVIIDVDGTLSDSAHRKKYIQKENPTNEDWNKFFTTADKDVPNKWCIELVKMARNSGYEIVYLTGRPEKIREVTSTWIKKQIRGVPFHLYMRPDNDKRHDVKVKTQIYKEDIEPLFNILFTVDDRRSVVKMWRDLGLTCLHCAEWGEGEDREADRIIKNDKS